MSDSDDDLDLDAPVTSSNLDLSSFYGIQPVEVKETKEPTRTTSGGASRVRDTSNDLDADNFDAERYVNYLVHHHDLKQLIQRDNEMVQAKKALDSDMQMLVYENYNKFISATDMIKKMKDNVESMESEMNALLNNMSAISTSCHTIEKDLTVNRAKVENLVGVSRLLKRLEFLFELPGRLTKAIEMEAYSTAVKYWQISDTILKRYSHMASFEKIRVESEQIINGLKAKLRQAVRDPTLKAEAQMRNAAMLIHLNEPPDVLLSDILTARRDRSKKDLQRAIDIYAGKDASIPEQDRSNLITLLRHYFVDSFSSFANFYNETFIDPYKAAGKKMDKQKQETFQKCQQALVDLTNELFNEYFTLVRNELLKRGNLERVTDVRAAIETLTELLSQFFQGIVKLFIIVPEAKLNDRTLEMIEHSIRHCVESVFEKTQANVVEILHKLHAQVLEYDPFSKSSRTKSDRSLPPDDSKDDSKDSKDDLPDRHTLPRGPIIASKVRSTVETGIEWLVPLLSTSDYLPAELGLEFVDVAHGHTNQLLHSFNTLFMCRGLRKSEGPVFDPPAPSPLGDLSTLVDNKCPLFYLYLSQICVSLEMKEIPSALKTLKRLFPSQQPLVFETDVPNLLTRMKETSQLLMQRYVESHGYKIQDIMRKRPDSNTGGDVTIIGDCVAAVYKEIRRIEAELAIIFPRASSVSVPRDPVKESTRPSTTTTTPAGVGTTGSTTRRTQNTQTSRNIHRDIARLFTTKVQTFGHVKFNRTDPLIHSLKIAFKALVETIRIQHFTPRGIHQLQLDVYAFRRELPESLSNDDLKLVHALLDETVTSATFRVAQTVTLVTDEALSTLYTSSRAAQPSPYTRSFVPLPPSTSNSSLAQAMNATSTPSTSSSSSSPSTTTTTSSDKPAGLPKSGSRTSIADARNAGTNPTGTPATASNPLRQPSAGTRPQTASSGGAGASAGATTAATATVTRPNSATNKRT